MKTQIEAVLKRDGAEAALAYAKQTLVTYRGCARNRSHFAHNTHFRSHYVRAIVYLRNYLKTGELQ